LKACGAIGDTIKGREIHAEISRQKLLTKNVRVGNALIDMYAKCGLLSEARNVFDEVRDRNIITWTSLLAGYAQLGELSDVCRLLMEMIESRIYPNHVTFLVLLSVCSHRGLVRKGQAFFMLMCSSSITPTIEHYNSLVDLLGRAGHLEEAVEMIERMPLNPDLRLWHTLLGACRILGNVEISKEAFQHAVNLDGTDDAAYICMYNIYANAGMQENADMVDALRIEKEAWCKSGISHQLLDTD
jgi:pentatricopeptide repeat protein